MTFYSRYSKLIATNTKTLAQYKLQFLATRTVLNTSSHLPLIDRIPSLRAISSRLRRPRHPILHETLGNILIGTCERIDTLLRRLQACKHKRLLEIKDDVLDVFEAEGDTDQVGGDAAFDLLFVWQLLVGGDPWVDDESFGIADVGEVGAEFEVVYYAADLVDVTRLESLISKVHEERSG